MFENERNVYELYSRSDIPENEDPTTESSSESDSESEAELEKGEDEEETSEPQFVYPWRY